MTKNHEYSEVPSVRRYVMLAQDGPVGLMFERAEAGWVGSLLTAEAILRMPEIGIEVPLHEFFEGVEFTSDQPDG